MYLIPVTPNTFVKLAHLSTSPFHADRKHIFICYESFLIMVLNMLHLGYFLCFKYKAPFKRNRCDVVFECSFLENHAVLVEV